MTLSTQSKALPRYAPGEHWARYRKAPIPPARHTPGEVYADFDRFAPEDRALIEPEFHASVSVDLERAWYCTALRRTSPANYITVNAALNLSDPDEPSSGDWHRGGWQVRAPENPRRISPGYGCVYLPCDDEQALKTDHMLGTQRLYDARMSLYGVGHPAGGRPDPVWAAHHERAIADTAWWTMQLTRDGYPRSATPALIAAWLWSDAQFDRLIALVKQLTPHVPSTKREGWERWASEISPWAQYT